MATPHNENHAIEQALVPPLPSQRYVPGCDSAVRALIVPADERFRGLQHLLRFIDKSEHGFENFALGRLSQRTALSTPFQRSGMMNSSRSSARSHYSADLGMDLIDNAGRLPPLSMTAAERMLVGAAEENGRLPDWLLPHGNWQCLKSFSNENKYKVGKEGTGCIRVSEFEFLYTRPMRVVFGRENGIED